MLKNIAKVFSILLIISGGVWILQGLSLLPGTIMRGNPQWVINGIIAILIGAGMYWFSNKK